MSIIIALLLNALAIFLIAVVCLIRGYKAITTNEIDSEKYSKGKKTLRAGIILSTLIFAALLIGSSLCLGMLNA